MREIIKQPFTDKGSKWEKNQRSYTGGFKGDAWLCKKGNTSRMAYCSDGQSDKEKKEAKEQTKRQSAGSKTPQLSMQGGQKKKEES